MIADEVSLTKEITDAFGLLGVLLVFVIAFFTYLLAQAETLVGLVPQNFAAVAPLRSRLTVVRRLLTGLGVATAVVILLLVPLLARVIANLWGHPDHFPTAQVGLVLTVTFLLILLGATAWERRRVVTKLARL